MKKHSWLLYAIAPEKQYFTKELTGELISCYGTSLFDIKIKCVSKYSYQKEFIQNCLIKLKQNSYIFIS